MSNSNLSVASKGVYHAMEAITDENSPLSIEERFDNLSQEMLKNAWILMRKLSKGQKVTPEEKAFQEEGMKLLHMADKIFSMLRKHKRIDNKPNVNFDKQLVQKIKQMQSTIGEIVQKLPDNN